MSTNRFTLWLHQVRPDLLADSYSFKRELLLAMERGYLRDGVRGAVEDAKPWPEVHKTLADALCWAWEH